MKILEGLEKLINEHCSVAILKERIALANDQYATLQKENESLAAENENLKTQIASLKEKLSQLEDGKLHLKYGVFWDDEGNPFCPKCKTPMSQIQWATYVNQQVHGLKCSCTEKPFVLMEKGEPIHAQEAMKKKIE